VTLVASALLFLNSFIVHANVLDWAAAGLQIVALVLLVGGSASSWREGL
jgi:hypothetical protein